MIISDAEIRNALELTRPEQRTRVPVASPNVPAPDDRSPTNTPPTSSLVSVAPSAAAAGPAHPMAPDPNVRLARLRGLRERLCAGTYDIEPGTVAEKMIGRAIVDQIAQLVDGANEADD